MRVPGAGEGAAAPRGRGAGSRGPPVGHPLTWGPGRNPWEGRPRGARRHPEPLPAGGWRPPRGGAGAGGPRAARGCTWRRVPRRKGESESGVPDKCPRGLAPPALAWPPTADCPEARHDLEAPGSLSKNSWCPLAGAMSSPTRLGSLPPSAEPGGGGAQACPSLRVPASGKALRRPCFQLFARIPTLGGVVGSAGCAPLDKLVWPCHLGPDIQPSLL